MPVTILKTFRGNLLVPPAQTTRRHQGFPPGGPAIPLLAQAALLLANPGYDPKNLLQATVLEITTPLVLLPDHPLLLAIAPAADPPERLILPPGEPFPIPAPRQAARLYLAWPGLDSPHPHPTPLNPNQSLPTKILPSYSDSPQNIKPLRLANPLLPPTTPIHAQTLVHTPNAEDAIALYQTYTLSPTSDRVGFRLIPQDPQSLPSPPPLRRSEPSAPGAVQITPDRTLLVHGPDGPTIGGYPKIAYLDTNSLAKLAALPLGANLTLQPPADTAESKGDPLAILRLALLLD